ncbi:MAG: glycosyltransferase family A protein [Candidatus Electrothrix aestuarii]|uniref:Glycosyltransferase family A protein n=1 Tax=Candidatus Electrothrix aestuarii TaxID=3062594 RepID=A0AAU8M1N5_9BACT|nr:glycosyltransferase family A protein [Candidatus Electrothrix aestuarii]
MQSGCSKGLFSVIVPTYNRKKLLLRALDSVKHQTYRPIEVVVVDDGSTDGTAEAVQDWKRNACSDGQLDLKYIYQDNQGAPVARNRALQESQGEFIQYLDSDDELYKTGLADAFEMFRKYPEYDCIHSGFDRVCGQCGQVLDSYTPRSMNNALEGYMKGALWGNTCDFAERRSFVMRVGPWDEELIVAQDLDYTHRRLLLARNVGFLARRQFVCYRGAASQISDHRYTRDGWAIRLMIEERFVDALSRRDDIDQEARRVYAEKLYYIAVRVSGEGAPDIGRRYGELAERVYCLPLSSGGKRMRLLWRGGKTVCRMWGFGRKVRRWIRQRRGLVKPPHVCGTIN